MVRKQPGADLPGFRLVAPADIDREAKYRSLRREPDAVREAVVKGHRRYDNAADRGQ